MMSRGRPLFSLLVLSACARPGPEVVPPTESTPSPVVDEPAVPDPAPASKLGCPDPLPAEWIACEDFEDFAGWGRFWTVEDSIAVEKAPSHSGENSLRISHKVGQYGSGMADLRFGQGPAGDVVAKPDASFREVWVRFYIRTHEDWPADKGISEAVEVMSVVGEERSIAVDATVYSPAQAQAQAIAWSCVHDSEMRCSTGNKDWFTKELRTLKSELGSSPLFGNERAGDWQCQEIHVRLDDPGQSNGMLEFWSDGVREVSIDGLEFVNAWTGAGLNNVRFASFWKEQAGLDHHVDDVVISTAPIGCD